MIGKLTFDKSSKDMNLFLYSVYIIGKYGTNNEIRRNFFDPCFIECMADFISTSAYNEDNREERTVYNKSLYAQYYGFIERKLENGVELLCLTSRGRILYHILNLDVVNKICSIKPEYQSVFQDMIWNSILYDSFGRFNDGAQTSRTDIDVPKVIFRVIFDLGYATNEEIFYVLFSLNRGDQGNLDISKRYIDLLDEIKANRNKRRYDYSIFFSEKGLKNKVSDSKVIDILADPAIGIINKIQENEIVNNYLSDSCERFREDSNLFECWRNPHSIILYSSVKNADFWLKNTILNKYRDLNNAKYYLIDDYSQNALQSEIMSMAGKASANSGSIFTFIVISESEDKLVEKMGQYTSLIKRTNNYLVSQHGVSVAPLDGVESSHIVFPSNFNFVSIITS